MGRASGRGRCTWSRCAVRPGPRRHSRRLASEGVILSAMVPACLALGCSTASLWDARATEGGGAVQGEGGRRGARLLRVTSITFAPGVAGTINARPSSQCTAFTCRSVPPLNPSPCAGTCTVWNCCRARSCWDFRSRERRADEGGLSVPRLAHASFTSARAFTLMRAARLTASTPPRARSCGMTRSTATPNQTRARPTARRTAAPAATACRA